MTFGEKLQMLRARRGLSQDALAEALEVSRQAVSRWERNETLPETEKVIRLSRYFSVTTDYLLLDEVQSPTGNGGNKRSPAAGLGMWFSRRGWLLGVGLAVLGGGWLLRLITGGWPYISMLAEGSLTWFQAAVQYGFACSDRIASAVGLIIAGGVSAYWGRRQQGRLRWYHLGWTAAVWSISNLAVQIAASAARLVIIESQEGLLGQLWLAKGGALLFGLGTALLGAGIALLGPRLDRPDKKADAAQACPGSGAEL